MNSNILNEIIKQDYNSIKDRIEKFLVNEVNQRGVKGVIFGLSGGIDSAVIAALCSNVLKEKSLALIMPDSKVTPEKDTEDGISLAKKCPNGLIISIEPDRDLYEKILENLKMNNFENVKCINCAISDVDKSKIKLFKGMNSTIFGSGDNYSFVESRTLDSIVSDFKLLQIDWLKIDVESAEVLVLKGAQNTLEMTKNLILEIHSTKNGKECLEILENNGFEIEIIKKSFHKEERSIEILKNMEDVEGNIRYYPIILAKNKKIS